MSKFQINFKGNKKEIHQQLKAYCKESEIWMNGLVISLIEKHLKKNLPLGRK